MGIDSTIHLHTRLWHFLKLIRYRKLPLVSPIFHESEFSNFSKFCKFSIFFANSLTHKFSQKSPIWLRPLLPPRALEFSNSRKICHFSKFSANFGEIADLRKICSISRPCESSSSELTPYLRGLRMGERRGTSPFQRQISFSNPKCSE